ncbi:tetratricopeptide repeat protein [Catellatospora methionotrophica]|uniref:tetratricopeptide repeat protein n=1 Tax=Catellatospora methionotrophica TaxID=121620 RepID=UPI0033D5AF4A
MDADESRSGVRRPRPVPRVQLDAGPVRELRDAIYELYVRADRPQLLRLAEEIAADDDLAASPGKDTIGRVIKAGGPASQQDTVAVAIALARAGRGDRAAVEAQVGCLWLAVQNAPEPDEPVRLGRPVADCDPLALEVHPAIQVPEMAAVGQLPGYVPRAHDERLRQVVDRVLEDGRSRLVTLMGGSSTGKTRACWEIVQYVDQQQAGQWRLWHPYNPTRPEAVLVDLDKVVPHTIVWLNEAQHYLMPADADLRERVASGLRRLLDDPQRAPVLVLATVWPDYWNALTIQPAADRPDPYGQARYLLAGTAVPVANAFSPAETAALTGVGVDPRVRYAAAHAEGGRLTQYLAGAPELETRYRTAETGMPAARAIIQVAMDARRLGHPVALPHALLEQAAPGYIDDHDWNDPDGQDEGWLEQALAYTAQPCKGARGPLTRIRTRPDDPPAAGGQPCYRLADYLEQLGRTERAGIYPPDSLWRAFTLTITDPELLRRLGTQAEQRGRYQHAIHLYQHAFERGDTNALRRLAGLREQAGNPAGAEVLAVDAADRGDTSALTELARMRDWAGDLAGAEALYQQAANRGDIKALRELVWLHLTARGLPGVETLAAQAADCGDTVPLRELAKLRQKAGDPAGAETMYRQAADRGDTVVLPELAKLRQKAGDPAGAEAVAVQAADRGDTEALRELAKLREEVGDPAGAEEMAVQAADRGDTIGLRWLAELRKRAGDLESAEATYWQAADRGDTIAIRALANLWEEVGDPAYAEALYQQAADCGDAKALRELAKLREEAGKPAEAEALAFLAADRGDTLALQSLVWLRDWAGNPAGAEALAVKAADRGDTEALRELAKLREEAGNQPTPKRCTGRPPTTATPSR